LLLDHLVVKTNLVTKSVAGESAPQLINATPSTLKKIAHTNATAELISPVYPPMLVPPQDWDSLYGSPYLTTQLQAPNFVRVKGSVKKHYDLMEGADLSKVYQAVNTLQRVPWVIDEEMLAAAIDEMSAEKDPKLPQWDPKFSKDNLLKEREATAMSDEEYTRRDEERKKHSSDFYKHQAEVKGVIAAREADRRILESAREYLGKQIYIPYNLDWRGRIYSICQLSYQGSDAIKGIFRFANGRPIGKDGLTWLKIHLANCYADGVDKLKFEDRIKWADENLDIDFNEAENPIQFLAAQRELKKANGDLNFVSSLPIGIDASCSGMQCLAGVTEDGEAAALVNLGGSDEPNDIYISIGDKLEYSAESKWHTAGPLLEKMKIKPRKLVKRMTMTSMYGVTDYGMIEAFRKDLRPFLNELVKQTGETMATLCDDHRDAFKRAFRSAAPVQSALLGWFEQKGSTSTNPLIWTAPSGFRVIQMYNLTKQTKVNTRLTQRRSSTIIVEPTDEINQEKMASGLAPNFTHSIDSALLVEIVNQASSRGLSSAIATIHDAYIGIAADIPLLVDSAKAGYIETMKKAPISIKDLGDDYPRGNGFNLDIVWDSNYAFS
jgi:DNA-directed RNA polymerase